MSNKKNKSSILSQLVGFTFLVTFASIIDAGLNQKSILFIFLFFICLILLYILEIRPTINRYKNSKEDIELSYQPISILIPSFENQLLIGLLCISIHYDLISIIFLKKFLLFYGLFCIIMFFKNQLTKK